MNMFLFLFQTIANVDPIIKTKITKKRKERFCSVCAKRGHSSENCYYAFRHLEYPSTSVDIISYQKIYEDVSNATIASGYNVHYNPKLKVNLHTADHASEKSFYSRAMKAVGLGWLLTRKHKRVEDKSKGLEPCNKKRKSSAVDEFKKPSPPSKPTDHLIDEDSNYSFSEYFPKSDSSGNDLDTSNVLPNFIPLNNENEEDNLLEESTGEFVEGSEDDSEENQCLDPPLEAEANNDASAPCEAKTYLTNAHGKYLLSTEGVQLMETLSAKHNIKADLKFASLCYSLILFGIRKSQDDFYTELLQELRSTFSKYKRAIYTKSTQMPKRTVGFIFEFLNLK